MNSANLIVDAFGRVHDVVHRAVDGLTPEQLAHRLDAEANTIGWLAWHLTRVQDAQVCDLAEVEQRWTAAGWADRFGFPFGRDATGYGQSGADVAAVRAEADLLLGYHDAVHEATIAYVSTLTDDALDRVVDTRWDPPVTLGVRLVSVIGDDLQHVGQLSFIRGLIERTT